MFSKGPRVAPRQDVRHLQAAAAARGPPGGHAAWPGVGRPRARSPAGRCHLTRERAPNPEGLEELLGERAGALPAPRLTADRGRVWPGRGQQGPSRVVRSVPPGVAGGERVGEPGVAWSQPRKHPQRLGGGGAWRDPEGRGLEGRDEVLMGVV